MLQKQFAKSMALLIGLCFLSHITYAQADMDFSRADTVRLEIKQAEKVFLDSNLQLLAQHYNIQSNKALVEQARKWDNPQLSTNQNIYNKQEGFFKHSTIYDSSGNPTGQGEIYADIEQLIKTAGKRRKQVDIAKTNVNLAEWQFNSTMRTLRMTLFTDYYTIAQLEGNAMLYNDNMQRLSKLTTAMKAQLANGDIAKKEYLRVQALIVTLQQNMTDNAKNIEDAQAELKTLLRMKGNIFIQPIVNEDDNAAMPDLSFVQLLDSAKRHNTDYQTETYQLQLQQQTLRLQKAMAIPDVTVGVDFDQHSTYTPNYYGLNIGLPLPLWDRNQGNIRSARYQVKQEEANMQQLDTKLENDVMNSYKKLLYTTQLNSAGNTQFYKDYNDIYKNIVEAFNNRQISLLEFLDYFGDYENTRQQQLQQQLNLHLAKEDLNDVVGIEVVH